jgi:hypothetical protein
MKLAKHIRVQLIWVPEHEGIEGNETINWQILDLNIRPYDLNQLAAFHQELPRRLTQTGQTETNNHSGSPQKT